MVAAPAWAGCFVFGEDSLNPSIPAPVVKTCYAEMCEQTTVIRYCGNVHFSLVEYANGWSTGFNIDENRDFLFSPSGQELDPIAFSCHLISGDEQEAQEYCASN